MVGYGAGAYMLTLLDRAGSYEHSDCGEYDSGNYPDAGAGGGLGGGSDSGTTRSGLACACQGGPGSGGNAVMFAIAGVLIMRRRRRA
jgi:MYXO-CTERM domain-containing protein